MSRIPNIERFQTARAPMSAADTQIATTEMYRPGLVDATVRSKMIGVHPYSNILLRCFGVGSDNDSNAIVISGWMFPPGGVRGDKVKPSGPGHRICQTTAILGTAVMGSADVVLNDGKWGAAALWREADTYGLAHNPISAVSLIGATGNLESGLVLPTLGYTHLLIEWVTKAAGTSLFGIIWRPLDIGGMIINPDGA